MQFSTLFISLAGAAVVAAQNAFTMATIPETIPAGKVFNITWGATTPGSVSIFLVQGPSTNIKKVSTIAANITNSGQYSWTPASTLPSGPNYALEITSDANEYITNYSGQFSLSTGTSVDSSPSSSNSTTTTTTAASAGATGKNGTLSGLTTIKSPTKTASGSGSASSSSSTTTPASVNSNDAGRLGAGLGMLVFLGALVAFL